MLLPLFLHRRRHTWVVDDSNRSECLDENWFGETTQFLWQLFDKLVEW